MAPQKSFNDPVLGPVYFRHARQDWVFSLNIPGRLVARGCIVAADRKESLTDQGLAEIRSCVRWIRNNEAAIRRYIANSMFNDWIKRHYDAGCELARHDVRTKVQFQRAMWLDSLLVMENFKAELYYDDGNLYGGHTIVVGPVGADGRLKHKPTVEG
jgi:hypothetical protein